MSASLDIIDQLGRENIRQALRGDTAEQRAVATQKIGREIRMAVLTAADRKFASVLLAQICNDVSELVRRALAVTLKNSPNLPRDLARRLIIDIDSIAVPVLKSSPVLTDSDLIDVLRSGAALKVKAIAQRRQLSLHVTNAIVSYSESAAVSDVASNDAALITPQVADFMAQTSLDTDLIQDASLARYDYPPKVVTALIGEGAEQIETNLEARPDVSKTQAREVARATAERAYAAYVGADWSTERIHEHVRALDLAGKLIPRQILRAAGRGDMRFTVSALSVLGGQSLEKTRLMVFNGGIIGIKAAASRARFQNSQLSFLTQAVLMFKDLEGRMVSAELFQKRLVERLLTSGLELSRHVEDEFLDILDCYSAPRLIRQSR